MKSLPAIFDLYRDCRYRRSCMDRLNSHRFALTDKPPTRDDVTSIITSLIAGDRNIRSLSESIWKVFDMIDGGTMSKTECQWGQLHPEDCQPGGCKRSRWALCWGRPPDTVPVMVSTKRNVYGVQLPIKRGEKEPPSRLRWSALNEIVDRWAAMHRIKCAGCGTHIMEGFDIKVMKLNRTIRLQVHGGVKYKHRTDKLFFCSESCRKSKRSANPVKVCARCGRTFMVDTASMEGTKLCFYCIKEYVLKYGLSDDQARLDQGPRDGSLWSFAIRGISAKEAIAAGFVKKAWLLEKTERAMRERITWLPTWKCVFARINTHPFMLNLRRSFKEFSKEKERPRT